MLQDAALWGVVIMGVLRWAPDILPVVGIDPGRAGGLLASPVVGLPPRIRIIAQEHKAIRDQKGMIPACYR
jgi:hypothetical protein